MILGLNIFLGLINKEVRIFKFYDYCFVYNDSFFYYLAKPSGLKIQNKTLYTVTKVLKIDFEINKMRKTLTIIIKTKLDTKFSICYDVNSGD